MTHNLQALVAGALTNVRNPRVDNDVISAGMVQDLTVESDGQVSFAFVISADDPASLVREARKAVQEVDGVTKVNITVREPDGAAGRPGPAPGATPVAGGAPSAP